MTDKQLKSLKDFNAKKRVWYNTIEEAKRKPRYNGIACPECGAELIDTNPNIVLTSNPPQKNIHCPNGDYRGYRLD